MSQQAETPLPTLDGMTPGLTERERSELAVPPRPARIGLAGTPSAMTHWGIHLARVILGVIEGQFGLVHGSHLADFAGLAEPAEDGDGREHHGVVICTSDCPEVALSRFLLLGPLIVFVEEPADVIDDLMTGAGIDAVNALRLATRSLCALQPLIVAPGTTVLGREHLGGTVGGVVDALLAALRLAPTPQQRDEIDRQITAYGPPGSARDHLGQLFPSFAARLSELAGDGGAADLPLAPAALAADQPPATGSAGVKLVARSYGPLVAGLPLGEVEWPPSIFSSGDAIGDYLGGPCEMVGPARIMIYGPYMHLPPGAWTARIEIEVADNESGNGLKVDLVGGPRVLVAAGAEMPMVGRYAFSLDFDVAEPLDPIELRFQIESGAIEGRFLLRRVTMAPRPGSEPDPA